jgi:hypothetical protein|tara:strand:+ start:981 stop:1298 length:318 start_codon:yes stop_codon:yes gene_type:complete
MNKKEIKKLINEAFVDTIYGKYPVRDTREDGEDHPDDYAEEWKSLCTRMVRDDKKKTAIKLAKILINDIELFEDVLDAAGQNPSLGAEILKQFEEMPNIDDEVAE